VPEVIELSDSDDEPAPIPVKLGRPSSRPSQEPPTPRPTPKKKRKFVEEYEEDEDGTRRVVSRREL
jgi:hypothetical protein